MTVGRPISQAELNNAWGGVAASLFATMRNIQQLKPVLDSLLDVDLTNMGFTTAEVALLRSAAGDMADLAAVFSGTASTKLTGTYAYQQFSKRLLGTGAY